MELVFLEVCEKNAPAPSLPHLDMHAVPLDLSSGFDLVLIPISVCHKDPFFPDHSNPYDDWIVSRNFFYSTKNYPVR